MLITIGGPPMLPCRRSHPTTDPLRHGGEILLHHKSNQSESNLAFLIVPRTPAACPQPTEIKNSKIQSNPNPEIPNPIKPSLPSPAGGRPVRRGGGAGVRAPASMPIHCPLPRVTPDTPLSPPPCYRGRMTPSVHYPLTTVH